MQREASKPRYFVIYKPFGMLSQFSEEPGGNSTLKGLHARLPTDVYPVGRLDKDSEGLLILTNDKLLNNRLLDPRFAHEREYWVQVEGTPTPEALSMLTKGVDLKEYRTLPARVRMIEEPSELPERDPPIRFRKNIPTSWISITLKEGKNRQVRRMTAAVGFPTLRLIRYRIEKLFLGAMKPAEVKELSRKEIYDKLFGTSI